MSTVIMIPGSTASTLLTHVCGSGLADDTYDVERFKTMVDGNVRRCAGEPPEERPARNERACPGQTRRAWRMSMRPALDGQGHMLMRERAGETIETDDRPIRRASALHHARLLAFRSARTSDFST